MNNENKKREDLERFVVEQIMGPGASGYRYVDINDDALMATDISDRSPLLYVNELIDIVPAGVYSTGMLFPENKTDDGIKNVYEKEGTDDSSEDDMEGGTSHSAKEDDEGSIEDEESIKMDQMFPNTMGFTCCLSEDVINDKEFKLKIAARYYMKQDRKDKSFNKKYGVLCECDSDALIRFISSNPIMKKFHLIEKGENKMVMLEGVSVEEMKKIKDAIKINQEKKAEEIKKKLSELMLGVKVSNLGALKQVCFYELKRKCIIEDERAQLYLISQEIEEFENIVSHLENLIWINDSRAYGLWKSISVTREVPLSDLFEEGVENRKIYSYSKYGLLRDIISFPLEGEEQASLSLNLQISRDHRKSDKKFFLKSQLVNTSTPFRKKEDDARYYSVFNEMVNKKIFFGVKISITNKNICPYNNIKLKEGKRSYGEDEVTRYVYRQFKDYGVGHGCSVKWDAETRTVETEYVPCCDTPDIDFVPKNKNLLVKNGEYSEPALLIEKTRVLDFKWLSLFSEAENSEVVAALKDFVDTYGLWIEGKRKEYDKADRASKEIAFQELNKCTDDCNRMMNNISAFLCGDPNKGNLESFRLMNSAMFMQLWHAIKVKDNSIEGDLQSNDFGSFDFYKSAKDDLLEAGKPVAWRAFQLAFILLNLDGIFQEAKDDKWEKRNEWVDLIWFPTGGGKTEAYLGISALTIINRRKLHGEHGGGTAVIMRYTLRLLTLQQFQRATLVIMALELLRRWDMYGLGKEPIFIGLWVGKNLIPNKSEELIEEFNKVIAGKPSAVPFSDCPWCGSKLSPDNRKVSDSRNWYYYNRVQLKCSNNKCSFSYIRPARARKDQGGKDGGGIPVSLCDEEIYQHPPSLIFGTVDKFAQLAHRVSNDGNKRNMDSRRIFGKGNWETGKPKNGYLPPDLIIQDELHLLLGPLGSSVALFEAAIDQLCRREDGTRPKIISSTATTRNAQLQIMALFDRKVDLFPKPGVDCDDSFFSFYKRRFNSEKKEGQKYLSKRRYMGILPNGRTHIWMQMRLAAILMTHRAIFEIKQLKDSGPLDFNEYESISGTMDYYHTIISYFNSLREVGKTESQVQSYLLKEIRKVFNRVLRPAKLMHSFYTYADSVRKAELTGRLSGEEVKNTLRQVQERWQAEKRFASLPPKRPGMTDNNEYIKWGGTPPDFVIATNMISVGIDVSRFNLIIMNSMPRNIAEYIQASSRVARDAAGLVLTVHHPFRARDVSHYEKFIEFHEKMYSYVEPISITPYTKKAIERYLGLYLVTLIRHTTEYVNREDASLISNKNENEIQLLGDCLTRIFFERVEHMKNLKIDSLVRNILRPENLGHIKKWTEEALNDWKKLSDQVLADNKALVFNNKSARASIPQEQLYVEIDEYKENSHSDKWQVPMSLRVIEPQAALKIKLR